MMNDASKPRPKRRWLSVLANATACLAILAASAAAIVVIQPERTDRKTNQCDSQIRGVGGNGNR